MHSLRVDAPLHTLEPVRCLQCGTGYEKPRGRGAFQDNPGCPSCGYVGWIMVSAPLERHGEPASGPRRSAEDPPLHLVGR